MLLAGPGLQQVADHLDDFEGWLEHDPYLRVSVWDARPAAGANRGQLGFDEYPADQYGSVLKLSKIPPHAVEIRSPLQVHRQVRTRRRS